MVGKKVGRNDPCPCGSGEKYKKCCRHLDESDQQFAYSAGIPDELRQALESQQFDSMEEIQAFVQGALDQDNQARKEVFHGLSPEQMHQLLYQPFSSPDLVTFSEPLKERPSAPILTLFELLVEAIGEDGLKPTARGNLPRNFCRKAALSYMGEAGYEEHTRYGGINKEEDFTELHVTRLVAEMAGLIRTDKGHFVLSGDCRKLMAGNGLATIYPYLFKTYVEKFNWGYRDNFAEMEFIQHSFLFTLYLLYIYGDIERPQSFYSDAYIDAFPMLLEEIGEKSYSTPREELARCYTFRVLTNFAHFLGLVKLDKVNPDDVLGRDYRVAKLPLLNSVMQFHLTNLRGLK